MNENEKQKIMKTILSLMISFLIIFIAAMFARAASNTVLPQNNGIAVFINDYLDMMMQKIDKIAVKMKIKRNSISEYQVNLITQSISDYIGYSMYQTSDSLKNFNPNNTPSKSQIDKYKNNYYKMTVENPYLRGMTVFNIEGKMLLNLYLSRNKSWPLELQDNLINEIKTKGSLVLNATNENAFYIMEYIKNPYGEIIVATRNDYAYVSDIAMYYQVADKRLYVSDARNSVYNVREAVGDNNIEKVSSVINRYAYYKKQPSFIVNDSLSVSMIGKEYPNYFELIVLAITALLILVCQLFIKAIVYFFKYIMQIKSNKDYVESIKGNDELISKNIVNSQLPKSNPIEEMPPIVQKVQYKIPDEYIKNNTEHKNDDKFNIGKDILNIVSTIKEEINACKNKFAIDKKDLEEKLENLENKTEEIKTEIDIETAFANIKKDLQEEYNRAIEETFLEDSLYDISRENEDEYYDNISINDYEVKENQYEENYDNIANDYEIKEEQYEENYDISINDYKEEENNDKEEFMSIANEELNNTSSSFIKETLSLDENILKNNISNNYKKEESSYENIDNEFNKKIIKNELLSSYKAKEEEKNKEYVRNLFNSKKSDNHINNDSHDISMDILNSYNKAIDNIKNKNEKDEDSKEDIKSSNLDNSSNSRTDDVFAAFDKMLSSIISKAEEDARRSITKK
ncbi:hypothetical protein BHAMNSH16_09590 [Brachyspira hampsonii]|uniref:Uncharacterized protein n=2 Tax=Brachyspira hampsonii TaxID=1287055 RepID=A0AAC9TV97_9SPIR|nr:hypothetical protein [Brachyspira hampsonii]ASJ21877.1 hypothetical protein BHAMNSH16_09590 [Brachyspira hampsonii]OEJ17255.1 hypothetical protein A9496_11660 [Brachyspira hampsonii]